jgi:hypothetical protein
MYKEKERLLIEFFNATQKAIYFIETEQLDNLLNEMDLREELIQRINDLDQKNGKILMSPELHQLLSDIRTINQELLDKMRLKQKEIFNKINSIHLSKQIRDHYNQVYNQVDGIFYDKRK